MTKAAARLKQLAEAEFGVGKLTKAELQMLRAASTDEAGFCGPIKVKDDPSNAPDFSETGSPEHSVEPWDKDREVHAKVIRWLCTSEDAKKLLDPLGIEVIGARIVGILDLASVKVPVPIELTQCRLMENATFRGSELEALDMSSCWTKDVTLTFAAVKHSVVLHGDFHVEGMLELAQTHIAHDLDLSGALVTNPSGHAIQGGGLHVGGSVFLRPHEVRENGPTFNFRAEGIVALIGASIAGDLDLGGAVFYNPEKVALDLERTVIGGALYLNGVQGPDFRHEFSVEGMVDLRTARCKLFVDDADHWPAQGQLSLDGFTYDSTAGDGWDAATRKKWLELDTSIATQPYRQLAKVLRESGQEEGATQILIAMEDKLASLEPPLKRISERVFLEPIGYGYRPARTIIGLAAVSGLGALLYWRSYRMGKLVPTDKDAAEAFRTGGPQPEHYPEFQPLVFSVENTFPLVKLGQGDKWQPARKSRLRWIVWLQILLGWLLATLFVAGIAGLVQHS
jgi:hypothetical protein